MPVYLMKKTASIQEGLGMVSNEKAANVLTWFMHISVSVPSSFPNTSETVFYHQSNLTEQQ